MTDLAKPALSVAAKELHAAISRLPKYFSEQEVQNAIAPYVLFHRRQTLEEVIRMLRKDVKEIEVLLDQPEGNWNQRTQWLAMSEVLEGKAHELEAELKKETPC